ncbi:MAG: hypothetical protein JHD07_22545 [Bradyrhizobium sp.]|uniref:hypothetical protein n=1 Tax=Bradyrhizobium sp. TaxID=376 RepID=UPI001A234910|nr:hypothetical protein [Bradyrhizobium sp.]MBJ7405937.1 hypothetical protein [Bradyrhizobium sp.]
MMLLRFCFLLVLTFLCSVSTSKAALIEASFAGIISGIGPYGGEPEPYTRPFSTTFTARFIFDTDFGTTQQIAPGVFLLMQTDGEAFASITLAPIVGHPFFGSGPRTYSVSSDFAFLSWQEGSGPILAKVDFGGHFNIAAQLNGIGSFQHGLCPSNYSPCGTTYATSSTFIDPLPVPGPTVGAGLPGFLVAVLAFVGWRRRHLATKHSLAAPTTT